MTDSLDVDGTVGTIAQWDEALRPIVAHVWNGKPLSLPTLVDSTYRKSKATGSRVTAGRF